MGTLGEVLAGRQGLSPVMVGRAAPLARLATLLPRSDSPLRLAMVSGEAGIGKTRLIRELLAGQDRLTAVAGHADQGSLGRPFDVVADALGGPPPLDADRVKVATEILLARLGDGPAVLVFEDLHWCDAESAAVFERVAASERRGLLLLATYRPDDLDRRLPGADLLLRLERRTAIHHVALERLDRAGVGAMIAAIEDGPVNSKVIEALAQRTGGNPFFIEELVVTAANLADLAGDSRTPLPWTLAEVVRRQLDGLDPIARQVIDAAAVLGRSASFDVLATVTRLTESELVAQLRGLVERGLLIEEADDNFRFRHALVRDAVEKTLLGRERRRLHETALMALEEACCPDLVELARHAAGAGRWEEMVNLCRRGAREAMACGSTFQALRLANDALTEAPDDVELLGIAAQAGWLVGLREEAIGTAERWLTGARRDGDLVEQSRATIQLARLAWELRRDDQRRDYVAEIERLSSLLLDGEDKAHALASIAQARMLDGSDDAAEWARRAVEMADRVGARAVRAQALVELASALAPDIARQTEAQEVFAEAVREAEAVGDRVSLARALNNMIGLYPAYTAEGRRLADRLREVAESAGYDAMARFGYFGWLAEAAVHDGDFAAAQRALEEAVIGAEGGIRARSMLARAELLVEEDDIDEAEQILLTDSEMCEPQQRDHIAMAVAAARRDPVSAAAVMARRSLVNREWIRHRHPDVLADIVDLALRAGMTASAIEEIFGGEILADPSCGFAISGLLAASRDQHQDAESYFARCFSVDHPEFHRPMRATLRVHWAEALLALGRLDEARAVAADAATDLARWAGWRRRELDQLLIALTPTKGRPAAEGPLTSRERDVAALIAEGLTNAQLARRLNIAPKTAAAHVSNILTKLAMTSRSEVAAWAAREGVSLSS